MESVNVFRKPKKYHELYLDTALQAIQKKYPNEVNRYFVHIRQLDFADLGLLVDYYTIKETFHARLYGVMEIPHVDYSQHMSQSKIEPPIELAFEVQIPDNLLKKTDHDGMYGRVSDELTGLDIHLFEGRVHDISGVVIEAEIEDSYDIEKYFHKFAMRHKTFQDKRDPKRIAYILSLIKELFKIDHDLRFFQLFYNLQHRYSAEHNGIGKIENSDSLCRIGFDLSFVDDNELIKLLEDMLQEEYVIRFIEGERP